MRFSIKYISSLLFILTFSFSADNTIKVGDQAPPISLFKLESNKYFRSKELLGEKNLVVSFFAKCNRSKGNKDDTDFRDAGKNVKDSNCPFCNGVKLVLKNNSVFAMKDNYPVSDGHHLIIPFRHTDDYFTMTKTERDDATELIRVLKNKLEQKDPTITGFNIGMNSGESAGQTVMHSHIHLIPRRDGDTKKPMGGVRGVIPDKMDY